MPDREKVIKALENCKEGGSCDGCSYDTNTSRCIFRLHEDALALLKEQEDVSNALVDQCDRVRRLRKELAEQPQIVLCKNCKHYLLPDTESRGECMARAGWFPVDADWFCADGEKKDE